MTEDEAKKLDCLCFESEELVQAISETIYELHARISQSGKCFDPFLDASGVTASAIVGRIANTVNTCFGIVFGVTPDDRYRGDLFLQVSTFCALLAKDHIFSDGNKRTALVISLALLQLRGISVSVVDSADPSDNGPYTWIESVVDGKENVEELSVKLREWARFGTYREFE